MAAREIPLHITDEEQRKALSEIAVHLETLERVHKTLIEKARAKTLTTEDAELLKKINAAHGNLDHQWHELAPSLVEAVLRGLK